MNQTRLIFQLVISLAVILPWWAYVFALFFFGDRIAAGVEGSITQITGGLIGIFGLAVGFWLGTSTSSQAKDIQLQTQTKGDTK